MFFLLLFIWWIQKLFLSLKCNQIIIVMKYIEESITSNFTIDHSKNTLVEICQNIDRELNNPNSDLDMKKLGRISRHLHNAIDSIKEAKEVINT